MNLAGLYDPSPGGLVLMVPPKDAIRETGYSVLEHWRKLGGVWRRLAVLGAPNLITNVGKNLRQAVYFGATAKSTFYIGLKGAGAGAAGDTMASHAGWSEVANYSQATRVAYGGAAGATGVWSNSASPATFDITGTVTVAGIFLNDVATKSGTTGSLHAVTDFTASRDLINGDQLRVTYTNTQS